MDLGLDEFVFSPGVAGPADWLNDECRPLQLVELLSLSLAVGVVLLPGAGLRFPAFTQPYVGVRSHSTATCHLGTSRYQTRYRSCHFPDPQVHLLHRTGTW
jgi:hypothetical protein